MCFDGGDGSGGAGIGGYGTDTNEDGRTSLVESLRDMTDGGGKGRSGDTFEGALSSISNTLGATPRGSDREPTGVAKFASEVTGIGGRANPTSGALLGALTGGLPGAVMGYASARGRNAVEDAGGLGSLFRGQTADSTMGIPRWRRRWREQSTYRSRTYSHIPGTNRNAHNERIGGGRGVSTYTEPQLRPCRPYVSYVPV